MNRTSRISILFGTVGLLAACQTAPSPYKAAEAPGTPGYKEEVISPVRTKVVFEGSRGTPRRTVEDYLLYRAAEVASEKGYDTFTLAGHGDAEARIFVTDRDIICDYSPADFSAFTYYAEGFGWAKAEEPDEPVRYRAYVYLSPGNAEADIPGASTWRTQVVLRNLKACVTGTGDAWSEG